MLAIEDSAAGDFLDGLADLLPTPPKAIVVASAHYEAAGPLVGAALEPPTIHDFGGFPPILYQQRYPAKGAPEVAASMVAALRTAGFDAAADPRNGLDHGVWVPLLRAWPAAEIPVVPLSVDPGKDAAWHYRVGQALAPLRRQGVLVIGSGSFSHNLRELDRRGGDAPVSPWMRDFTDALRERLMAGNHAGALDWRALPEALRNHPTPEHLYPLYVALGAAQPSAKTQQLHRSVQYGALAMDAFAFA